VLLLCAARVRRVKIRWPDYGSRYYEHWLAALERLVTEKGLTNREAMAERKEAWADAYRHTPHGKPVELAAGAGPVLDHEVPAQSP
jgi:Nitrile hydratase beta subunit